MPFEKQIFIPKLNQEIEFVNPQVIIPIGRLAINLFFPKKLKLQDIIGAQKEVAGRWIIPLPHSSGASRWHQIEENRQLITDAIKLINNHRVRIFPA